MNQDNRTGALAPVPRLLDSKTTAQILNCTKQKLEQLCAEGVGPRRTRVGSRFKYREDHLFEWLESQAEPKK